MAAPLAFRRGLIDLADPLSHFMHGEGLAWRLSAAPRPARRPAEASDVFLDVLEQPMRFPAVSTRATDHSERLFIDVLQGNYP